MCTNLQIIFSCSCQKEMDFIQYKKRQGTNVRYIPSVKALGKTSLNYYRCHLVPPGALTIYVENKEVQEGNKIIATE